MSLVNLAPREIPPLISFVRAIAALWEKRTTRVSSRLRTDPLYEVIESAVGTGPAEAPSLSLFRIDVPAFRARRSSDAVVAEDDVGRTRRVARFPRRLKEGSVRPATSRKSDRRNVRIRHLFRLITASKNNSRPKEALRAASDEFLLRIRFQVSAVAAFVVRFFFYTFILRVSISVPCVNAPLCSIIKTSVTDKKLRDV